MAQAAASADDGALERPEPEKPALGRPAVAEETPAQSERVEEKSEAIDSEAKAVDRVPASENLVTEPVKTNVSPPEEEQLPQPKLEAHTEATSVVDQSGPGTVSGVSSEAKAEEATAEEATAEEATAEEATADEEVAKAKEPMSSSEDATAEAAGNTDKTGAADDDATPEIDSDRIKQLKGGLQALQLSPTLSQDLQGVEITPEEGFLLSRIDGSSHPKDIIAVSPMSESDTERALLSLLEKDLIRLGGVAGSAARSEPAASPEPSPSPPRPSVDEAVVAELDRLLALGRERDFPGLLGVSETAAESERKRPLLPFQWILSRVRPPQFR